MISRRHFTLGVLSVALLSATGCGRKGALEPPEDREEEYRYPHQYPAPDTVVPSGQAVQGSQRRIASGIEPQG